MVFYFLSDVVKPEAYIYIGEDKYENDKLFPAASPGDVWFHVDDLSSAHIYLRVGGIDGKGVVNVDAIPSFLITDCVQLTKANSIQGSKESSVDVIYTMTSNLKKTAAMSPGEVSFFDPKAVVKVRSVSRDAAIVKRLEKTRTQRPIDELFQAKERREREQRDAERERKRVEKEQAEQWRAEKEARSYDKLFSAENMTSNQQPQTDDDFM